MMHLRQHGRPPYRLAVLHGGPGAAGEVAPVAQVLAARDGVLEPLQTAASVWGQVEELAACLSVCGQPPLILIGYSWGAWLGLLLTASHPALVQKLLLVGCPPLAASSVASITQTRLRRLPPRERLELAGLFQAGNALDHDSLQRLGALCAQADTYDPATPPVEAPVAFQAEIFASVWPEAAALRQSGELVRYAASIRCPVRAIHGQHDPHPTAGVREPLAACLADFHCVELPNCGHTPWRERQARDAFFQILAELLQP